MSLQRLGRWGLLLLFSTCACGESKADGTAGGDEPDAPLPVPEVPTIDSLEAYRADDGAMGFSFEGRPGPVPVRFVHLEWVDDGGQVLGDQERVTLDSYWAFSPGAVAHVEQSNVAFTGWVSRSDPPAD